MTTTRMKLWLFPAAIYALFFVWYTDLGGPLSASEIDKYMATMTANGSDRGTIDMVKRFASADTGRQFLMVNNIEMNKNPPDVEGAEPGESADQLIGRYMQHMFPALLSRASHPVIAGPAVFSAMDLVGIEGAETWDQGALFRYRSRRTFLDIVTNPVFADKHDFKTAALAKTIAYPIEASLYLGDPRLLLGLIVLALTALLDNGMLSAKLRQTQSN